MYSLRVAVALIVIVLLSTATSKRAQGADPSPNPSPFATPARGVGPGESRISVACTPVLGVTPDPVDFGDVEVGQIAVLDVSLSDAEGGDPNDPTCGIRIDDVVISLGSDNFQLSGLPTFPIFIPLGGSFSFQARFTPASVGIHGGVMVITSNDVHSTTREVNLRGVGVIVQNQPPTCNAGGPYTGTVGVPVAFDGSGSSDPDGTIASYAWDFGDGSTGTGATPTHAYASAGDFTASLTVTDDGGAPSTCTAAVSITEIPQSIDVVAPNGGEEFSPGETTMITWTSEGGVGPVDVDLSIDGGSTFFTLSPDEPNDGTFEWVVLNRPTTQALIRVSDAADGVPADQSDAVFTINGIEVTRPNGGESFFIGAVESINWDRFGTEIANVVLEYSVDDGTNWISIAASAPNTGTFSWTVTGPATQLGRVRVTDAANALAMDISDATFNIVEPGGNVPPICNADGPYTGTLGVPVAFDGSGSNDPDGTIDSYAWDFGDGATETGATPSHAYANPGKFVVSLTVTDNQNASSTCTTTADIGVDHQPPVCNADGPYTGTVGVPVAFDGSGSSDPGGTIVLYAWDFGDGGTGTGATPTHTYASAGDFNVSLTVTDNDGDVSSCGTTASITGGKNQSPICDADGPYSGLVGVPIVFDGTGSSDPDGTIASYHWDFGDGSTGSGDSPTHAYATAGNFNVSLTVTDNLDAPSTCGTTAAVTPPAGQIRVAVPPRVFGAPTADVIVPIIVLDDVTGQGILSSEISITYNPRVLEAKGVSLAGTIGQGGSFEWDVETLSETEEIVRLSIAWVTPIAGCDEMAFINFRATRPPEHDHSVLDLEVMFNEGTPPASAIDGEFIKGMPGDVNCSANISPADASLVLQNTVGTIVIGDPHYPCLTVERADVSGNEDISAFDGSLILRFVLGLIDKFPIEENPSCGGGFAGSRHGLDVAGRDLAALLAGKPRAVTLEGSSPVADGGIDVTVSVDDFSQVYSGDFTLEFDPAAVRATEVVPLLTGGRALTESRMSTGKVQLALALAEAADSGPAQVARVHFVPVDADLRSTVLKVSRAELNEGSIPATASGAIVSLPGESPTAGAVQVVVPERVFGAHDTDVLIPVFVRDDLTGRSVLSTEITLDYDPAVLEATGVDLAGTIGEGGSFEFNVVHLNQDFDQARLTIAWTTPRSGCGTLANLIFRVSQDLGPATSLLDLEIQFNEGSPATQAGDGTFIRGLLGDTNGSRNLSSLDASLILNAVVGQIHLPDPHYPNLVVEIADVSGNLEIRAFDAALVLQRVLGIIDHFPVENELTCNAGRRPLAAGSADLRHLRLVRVGEKDGVIEAALILDRGESAAAVEAALTFDPASVGLLGVDAAAGEGSSLVASRMSDGRVEIAAVVGRPQAGEARLAVLRFQRLRDGEVAFELVKPTLNEGAIPVEGDPARFAGSPAIKGHLEQNRPNPFNPSTAIAFTTPGSGRVELAVYDLGGRQVRSLVLGDLAPGEHLAVWDGRDDHGRPVAGGVYLYRLHAAGSTWTRKMILIR